jgi:hypothetical protein
VRGSAHTYLQRQESYGKKKESVIFGLKSKVVAEQTDKQAIYIYIYKKAHQHVSQSPRKQERGGREEREERRKGDNMPTCTTQTQKKKKNRSTHNEPIQNDNNKSEEKKKIIKRQAHPPTSSILPSITSAITTNETHNAAQSFCQTRKKEANK